MSRLIWVEKAQYLQKDNIFAQLSYADMKAIRLAALMAVLTLLLNACSHKTIPGRANGQEADTIPALPVSDIDVPVQVNLKPVFSAVEQSLQLEYSSPGWPDEYEEESCTTRYMYSFRTGGLIIRSTGNTMAFNFTGLYQAKANQRACPQGKKPGPWQKNCVCGMDTEEERRMNTGFSVALGIRPDYRLNTLISTQQPQPLDSCADCVIQHTITGIIVKKVQEQLDGMRQLFQVQLDSVKLRPMLEKQWNKFSLPQYTSNVGYINVRPSALRLSPFVITNDTLLHVTAGVTIRPEVSLHASPAAVKPLPNLQQVQRPGGFEVYADLRLQYDSLTKVVNRYVKGLEYHFKKGIIKKDFVLDSCQLYGAANNILVIKVFFSGTDKGIVTLFGQPVLDTVKNTISLLNAKYDVRTRDLAINLGVGLFKKRIRKELTKYTSYNFSSYIDTAKTYLTKMLNRSLTEGIEASGNVSDIRPLQLEVLPGFLFIRVKAKGAASIKVKSFAIPAPGASEK